ncbi:MAG: lipopolysaccharide heptosyltransferase II [Candidatus Omnitrophica bacterium]|nr:lipopolysaccharide heptosyltransferase II [Candidatus Omnitrophota bacterium]
MPKKVLFITLSNIGDVILTLPALDRIKAEFPDSKITVLSSLKAAGIFSGNPFIDKFIVYDKGACLRDKFNLFRDLEKENFDLVVDLKDTFLGFILKIKAKSFHSFKIPKVIKHMKDKHLYRAGYSTAGFVSDEKHFYIGPDEEKHVAQLLVNAGVSDKDKTIVISAGARSYAKRWPKERFAELASDLIKDYGAKIILVGDREDIPVNRYISESLKGNCLDLTAKTSLRELACLLKKSSLVISNDSAVMHMASYFDKPVIAIFGITDDIQYGPWSKKSSLVKKEIYCRPCQKAQCRFETFACLNLIKVDDVLSAARVLLANCQLPTANGEKAYKRILIIRTDRIGDVVLSTPVIKAVRQSYPHAFIAMMVSPYTKEIVYGNPSLDEVIVYDKDARHKSWLATLKFAGNLKKQKFDAAVILHPTNRAHLIAYLAGIPKRIGYDRKFKFLITDKIPHTKQSGERHESEYNLDLLKPLNIEVRNKELFMPIKAESEGWAGDFLKSQGIRSDDKILIINPSASCPSKVWPASRFSEVADELAQKYNLKVLVVSGSRDLALAENVIKNMTVTAISLAGKISLSRLASILKRASLFISNDSGPVHIASAVGTPVISIFGRQQKGLSPKRWGPLGIKDRVLHKDVGCIECLAHNCKKEFACLKAITVDDVVSCADAILK